MPRKRITPPVELLEQRLEELGAVLPEIERRLQGLEAQGIELARVRDLALEAVAQAQDAQATAKLVSGYDARLNHLTLAVAEGIQHVERAENRIRATVRRAREELLENGLEPSPGLDAEARELRLVDGGGSPPSPVHPVRAEVGEDEDEIVALPGVPGRVRRGFLKRIQHG